MKRFCIIIFGVMASIQLFSQEVKVVNDIGFWGGLNIEKEIVKDFKINIEQQIRLYTNITEFDDYLIDFGGLYRVNKNFKLGGNIRYTYNAKRWKENEHHFRYNLDLKYRGRLSYRWRVLYRLRYQYEYAGLLVDDVSLKVHYSNIRNKLLFEYDLNKNNDVYLSGELFRLSLSYKDPFFNKIRFYLGDKFQTRIGKINIALGYEQELNNSYPLSFFFLKTVYTIRL